MTARTAEMSADLPCHRCGYDLRAHSQDGRCPECGASVAESRRLAAIPLRPAWRDSDPRWRRRMLAGTWILVLLPLMDVLLASGWASSVPVPAVFDFRGSVRTLHHTLLSYPDVYHPLVFCIGVVVLFSKERGRRESRLDWTRRWGVLCSYVVLLLSAVQFFFLAALVLTGVAAVFQAMPPKYQPSATQFFVDVSTGYLRYAPSPKDNFVLVLVAFSSITILLACIALFDALRSSGPNRFAAILLAPLALFALMYVGQAALDFSARTSADVSRYEVYFSPDLLVSEIAGFPAGLILPGRTPIAIAVEATKWCLVFGIAAWLSIAQLAAWWRGKEPSNSQGPALKGS